MEREGGAVHSRSPGSQLHVQLGRQRRGHTVGSWTQQQSTPAHGPVRASWPLGATPGALSAFALRPAGVWAAGMRGLSVSGALLSLCGMGHSDFHPPQTHAQGQEQQPWPPRTTWHGPVSGCLSLRLPPPRASLQGSAQPLPGAQPSAVCAQLLSGVGVSSELQVLGLQGRIPAWSNGFTYGLCGRWGWQLLWRYVVVSR